MRRAFTGLVAGLVVFVCFAAPASAAVFPVTVTGDDGNDGELRNAIAYANDEVVFPGRDTILISAMGQTTIDTDALRIFSDVDIVGPGPDAFTISGDDIYRVFDISFGKVSISGVKLIQGSDNFAAGFAGGIAANGESLTLNNVVITSSEGTIGGAIYNGNGRALTVNNSTIGPGNITADSGGGIYNDGTATINNSTVTGNAASVRGGGISNGDAVSGSGALTVSNSTLSDNSTNGKGGGIFNNPFSTATLNGTTLLSNDAVTNGGGGGITNNGDLIVTNSTFSGNETPGFGGAIDSFDAAAPPDTATTSLTSATIVGNTANLGDDDAFGSGGGLQNGGAANSFSVANTLLAGNHVGPVDLPAENLQCSGTYVSGGFNLRQTPDSPGCTGFAAPGDAVPAGALMLGALAANGGPTQTVALLPGSPAVNAGGACPATDQRGYVRGPVAPCDIGAFELGALPPVPASPAPPPAPPPLTPAPKRKKCTKKRKGKAAASAKKKKKKCKKKKKK